MPPAPSSQRAAENQVAFSELDGTNVRIGIIKTRWNPEPVGSLLTGCKEALKACKVKDESVFVTEVPGAYEVRKLVRLPSLSLSRSSNSPPSCPTPPSSSPSPAPSRR